MGFNKNHPNKRNLQMFIRSSNEKHKEKKFIKGGYNSDQWNTGKIVIRKDGKVEFHINNQHVWTTTKTIDPSFNRKATIKYSGYEGGGPAFADNLIISRP